MKVLLRTKKNKQKNNKLSFTEVSENTGYKKNHHPGKRKQFLFLMKLIEFFK